MILGIHLSKVKIRTVRLPEVTRVQNAIHMIVLAA